MKVRFKPLRAKHWDFGKTYLIPTFSIEWSFLWLHFEITWLSYSMILTIERKERS